MELERYKSKANETTKEKNSETDKDYKCKLLIQLSNTHKRILTIHWKKIYEIVLYEIVLYKTVLYETILYETILYKTVL